MGLVVLKIVSATVGLVILPGVLLQQVLWRRGELSVMVGAASGFAVTVVVWVNLASLLNYKFEYALAANLLLILTLLGAVRWRNGHISIPQVAGLSRESLSTIVFWLLVLVFFLAPLFVMPVSYDTDAQGFGHLALAVRKGGTIDTLAPFYPEIKYLYSPAYPLLVAYFSDMFALPIHQVMMVLSHFTAFLCVIMAYQLGIFFNGKRAGLPTAFSMWVGMGLFTALMDSHYTAIQALLLVELFLLFLFRAMQSRTRRDMLMAGLALASIPLSHPDMTMVLLIGYVPFWVSIWFSREKVEPRDYLVLMSVPVMGIALASPWLVKISPLLLSSDIRSPFGISSSHWSNLIIFNGIVVPLVAIFGFINALQRRKKIDVFMVTWIIAIVDFSLLGISERALDTLNLDLLRYSYPFSIAWHGPIIPFALLSGLVLTKMGKFFDNSRITAIWQQTSLALYALGIILLVGLTSHKDRVIQISKGLLSIYGAFSSQSDIEAMMWLKQNTVEESVVLNYPWGHEGHWVPVISERQTIYFRMQRFFKGAEAIRSVQEEATQVYKDPASRQSLSILRRYGIFYVVVPQVLGNPDSFATMQRWEKPRVVETQSQFEEAAHLQLVYEESGAKVFKVMGSNP